MLYQIGPVTVDVFPFNASSVDREGTTEYAKKDILGRMPAREFVGPGDETITFKGQVLPTKIGGQDALDALNGLRRAGERMIVVRGDGRVFGWYAIDSVHESDEMIGPDGVGQVIKHEVKLTRVDAPSAEAGASLLNTLLGLF